MAHSQSALKRWRQNERRRARNKTARTATRTAVKKARTAIATGDGDAQAAIREAMSVLDRAAKKNVIHENAAARHKARLMVHLNQAGGAASAETPKRARKSPAKKAATKASAKTATKRATKTAKK